MDYGKSAGLSSRRLDVLRRAGFSPPCIHLQVSSNVRSRKAETDPLSKVNRIEASLNLSLVIWSADPLYRERNCGKRHVA